MRTLIVFGALVILTACSPQDKQQAQEDTKHAEQKIRESAQEAGREIKKDFRKADEKLTESAEKGKVAAQRAGRELRKELQDDTSEKDKSEKK